MMLRALALAVALPARSSPRAATRFISASAARQRTVLSLNRAEDTEQLGARLAEAAQPGDVLLLHGDYGAGKTCLARGFLRRWFEDPTEIVTSPSYLIDNVYDDPEKRALQPGVTVHHMDLWRLPEGKVTELVDLPSVFSDCVSMIEWPHRLGADAMPAEYLDIEIRMVQVEEESGTTRLASAARDDGDGDVEESEDEGELEIPREATLTAVGDRWKERLLPNAEWADHAHGTGV
jgi:tRNA threonylcarbamoyladenosine biosynthesis protein TsaE